MVRNDQQDLIYKTEDAKWNAVDRRHHRAQRGRASRSWSAPCRSRSPSACPALLNRRGVQHNVLNAKNHEKEAMIVAQAGPQGRRSRWRRTWPAAASTSCWAATPSTSPARRWPRADFDNDALPPVRDGRGGARGLRGRVRADLREVQGADRRRARGGRRAGRALRAGHRAARVAADRQPAARPCPAGRATRASRGSTSRSRTT